MFGLSKCGKCETSSFRIQEISPQGAQYKMFTVQCTSCSTPIGVTDYYSAGTLIKNQEKAIARLQATVDEMAHKLNQIGYVLSQMAR